MYHYPTPPPPPPVLRRRMSTEARAVLFVGLGVAVIVLAILAGKATADTTSDDTTATGSPTGGLPEPAGTGTAGPDEQGFLDRMNTHPVFAGASVDDESIAVGHTTCESLDLGMTPEEVIQVGLDHRPSMHSVTEWAEFVGFQLGASVRFLCPQHLNLLDQYL